MNKTFTVLVLCVSTAWAQGTIVTVAGSDFVFPATPMMATSAPTGAVAGLAIGKDGSLYLTDTGNSLVLRVNSNGVLAVVAGTGREGFSGDGGPATRAGFNAPKGVAIDSIGNLLIADTGNNRIRKIGLDGVVTTIAGTGRNSFSGDGLPAIRAGLDAPAGVAADTSGNIYIADTNNLRVRKIAADGLITTVAGDGKYFDTRDGASATTTSLYYPTGLAVDAGGNLYIAGDWSVRRVTPDGQITSISSVPPLQFCGGITKGVVLDTDDNLLVTNVCNQVVQITASTEPLVLAGKTRPGFAGDGSQAISAQLFHPLGICIDWTGNILIADTGNNRVRAVDTAGVINTVVGNGGYRFGGDGGDAANAWLWYPQAVAIDAMGGLFIADTFNNRIRHVTADGTMETVAGNGTFLFSGDGGPALAATLGWPLGVAIDSAGAIFIADSASSRTRKVFPSGLIDTILGGGSTVAIDSGDNVYVADAQFIYKLTPAGASIPIAGFGGDRGDGGPAVNAQMGFVSGLAIDAAGNLFIADSGTGRVRKVTPDGIISTVAGNGQLGYSGDGGPATDASFFGPAGIAVDGKSNLYIADFGNHRVRKVGPDGIISTVAGTGRAGFSGDGGLSTGADLNHPEAVATDALGNLYIADSGNNRIRKIQQ